ncbi:MULTISPECIES: TetR/AcrR family transcriptional regulator [unclassified Pseudofrankia]|uniref:TetR/AcrR family transcriptional regulator n=1 Tax=unclassified Pseudofrankia TaxID=2994372 RepID=UPI0008D9A666|nr:MULTISPECIES: TetR/AcrR family transcriptional regulator [unclassified Pseudofrankia]MDT3446050.1 helix-turn-helix domain-containing protein [Pseudofrankia sp. BMG5.37]OHV55344.1 TetR family transcriptional regulator [Pseudofrankia sp. BMG5.36]
MEELSPGLRERTRRAVQADLMSIAMRLFVERGYDGTSVEEIATEAGISKRSFFRYFGSKEDVVLGNLEYGGQQLASALAERPDDEPAWTALRRAFEVIAKHNDHDPTGTLAVLRMLRDTPSLKARHLEKQSRWRELLAPHLAPRLPPRPPTAASDSADPRAVAIAGAALACLDAAQTVWVAAEGRVRLANLLDESMGAVGVLPSVPAPGQLAV